MDNVLNDGNVFISDLTLISSIKVYSFDIFDTTVTRYVAHPTDIFWLIQDKLRNEDKTFTFRLINEFPQLRGRAELAARWRALKKNITEISLVDIYQQMAQWLHLDQQHIEKLMEIEIQLEYDVTSPIAWTIEEIKLLKRAGKRVIFTSDMYLHDSLIQRILNKTQVYEANVDHIYLSNQLKLRKSDGSLFKYILEKEQCSAHELAHFGDDAHSDIAVPYKMGITIYKTPSEYIQRSLRTHRLRLWQKGMALLK